MGGMKDCYAEMFCKCGDTLRLVRHTQHAFGLEGEHVMVALELAAAYLGWRKTRGPDARFYCPRCCDVHLVVCERCWNRTCTCTPNNIMGVILEPQ